MHCVDTSVLLTLERAIGHRAGHDLRNGVTMISPRRSLCYHTNEIICPNVLVFFFHETSNRGRSIRAEKINYNGAVPFDGVNQECLQICFIRLATQKGAKPRVSSATFFPFLPRTTSTFLSSTHSFFLILFVSHDHAPTDIICRQISPVYPASELW